MRGSRKEPANFPNCTLGILAGGQATRLGGIDKAWLQRDCVPQVLRLHDMFVSQIRTTLVSTNRNLPRYVEHGLQTVADRIVDAGPLAGIDALVAACRTEWLMTLPVDVVAVPPDFLARFAANGQGTFAEDGDGSQPLIALWPVAKTRDAVASSLAANALAVHELQSRLDMLPTRFGHFRFGNLNTPDDLDGAGVTIGTI
ncbi:MAG: NTP transferase domain-containing protein [Lysobacter sp.]|nr:NTP transferase domain-containing protein [Lysobacter sp.]